MQKPEAPESANCKKKEEATVTKVISNHPKVKNSYDMNVGCGVCGKPHEQWKRIVDQNGNPWREKWRHSDDYEKHETSEELKKETILYNPWYSDGEYGIGRYSTWNPRFNDRRIFSPYCYECWSKNRDYIMVVDGNACGGLHLVTNWCDITNFKVKRSTGHILNGNKFFTRKWNEKNVPDSEKTNDDKEKEKETIMYCYFDRNICDFMAYVDLSDGLHKPVSITDLKLLNPDFPEFRFRFPNRIMYHKVLQWANKNTERDHEKIKSYGLMSEWYDPDL